MAADGRERGGLGEALRPRYVDAAALDGLYESLYFTAHHPTEARALWVRHTVLKPPGGSPWASLWCTWFADGAVRAAKVTTGEVSTSPDRALQVGEYAWVGAAGAAGAVGREEGGGAGAAGAAGAVGREEGGGAGAAGAAGAVGAGGPADNGPAGDGHDGLRARWDLVFRDPEAPMFHLPMPWMYTAPLPRTKSLSAAPMLRLGGSLEVGGRAVEVDGWPCSIGHNWGAEHAERWIWIHADAEVPGAASAVAAGPVWLDVVIGRIRLGPLTTPWIANGVVSIAGRRHRLGGLRPGAGTRVTEPGPAATVSLRGSGITVEVRSEIDPARCVAWTYADPRGHTREVVNCSVAPARLTVSRRDGEAFTVAAPVSAFEVGAPRRGLDVPLQPFPD